MRVILCFNEIKLYINLSISNTFSAYHRYRDIDIKTNSHTE